MSLTVPTRFKFYTLTCLFGFVPMDVSFRHCLRFFYSLRLSLGGRASRLLPLVPAFGKAIYIVLQARDEIGRAHV